MTAANRQLITDSGARSRDAARDLDVAELLRCAAAAVVSGNAVEDAAVLELVQPARRLTGIGSTGSRPPARLAAAHGSSDREREVPEPVARGFSVSPMARSLFLSNSTVTFTRVASTPRPVCTPGTNRAR